jgi:cardiolipin synthase
MRQEPVEQGVGVEPVAPQSDLVFTVPNLISFLRLLLVPVFAYLIIDGWIGWALLVLAVSGVSDFLDGYLARTWHQESELGRKLDPAADRLYILATLIGLMSRGLIPWWLVVLIVARDLMLLGTLPALRSLGLASLPVHYLGKAATFNLLYAFPLILLGEWDSTLADIARPLGWAFAWWGTGLYWWAGVLYLRQLRELIRADRALASGGPPEQATA